MGEPIRQIFSNGVPKEVYDRQSEKIDILEEVLKFSVAEQIKRDRDEIERLKQERDTLKGQISNFETWRDDLISKTERQIKEQEKTSKMLVSQATTRRNNVETDYNILFKRSEQEKRKLNTEINKLNEHIIDLEKRIIEYDALLKSREEEISRLKTIENKVDTIYNYLTINLEEIKTMIINSNSKEEIIDTIEETKETLKSNGRLDDLERDVQIAKDLASGESKSTVASKYLGHRSQPMSALSRKLKADRFNKLVEYFKGNISNPPVAYKEVIK